MTPELTEEIRKAIANPATSGYYVGLQMHFLGRRLKHCAASFYKLSLFRRGAGRFECRLKDQDASMADMEVHEHVLVNGATATLKNQLVHYNVESLSHYIKKHDEYSNWEAKLWTQKSHDPEELPPALFGSQAQRRRWLKRRVFYMPGTSILFFLYKYVFRAGFLDGIPGLIFCGFQGIQIFQVKAKIYELRSRKV
jgi:hypothetical protein